MGFYTAMNEQTVPVNGSVVFTTTMIPDNNVGHLDGTGSFQLSGGQKKNVKCPCCKGQFCKNYPIRFGANIAVAEGGTAGEISLSISVGNSSTDASIMRSTPAAAQEFNYVGRSMPIPILCGCCQTVTITNTSNQPIVVQGATLEIET